MKRNIVRNISLGVIAVGVLVTGVIVYIARGDGGTNVSNVPNSTVQEDGKFGASSGPDSFSPFITNNGVLTEFRSEAFRTSSSTFASVKNPSASSTPIVRITVTAATSTDYVLVLNESTSLYARPAAAATSSGAYGSSRRLAEWVVPAGTTPTFIFTATSTTLSSDVDRSFTASPDKYLVVFADDGGLRFPEGVSSTGITGRLKVTYLGY